MPDHDPALRKRLERRVEKRDGEDGCWLWLGMEIKRGYGKIDLRHGQYLVHRLMHAAVHGPIPRDLCVLHRCDNPRCINPDHLKLGTRRDNSDDMVARGRADFGGHKARAQLPLSDVWEVLSELDDHDLRSYGGP